MRTPNVIYNYWDYGIIGVLILLSFPSVPSPMHNFNLSIWGIVFLCFVSELNGRKQAIKRMKTSWMLPITPKKRRRFSIDHIAYLVFTVSVIMFYVWLAVFA